MNFIVCTYQQWNEVKKCFTGLWLRHFYMQVASSEWVLGVHIHQFMNVYNAEIRNGKYCCCDDHFKECWENITDVNGMCLISTYHCDTYFMLHVRECSSKDTCTDTKSYQLNEALTSLEQLVLLIPVSDMELSKNVRVESNCLLKEK